MPRWLPNALSALRLGLVPVFLALALWAPERRGVLLAVLAIAGATDLLDGYLARRFKLATNLGATLDAVADKLATFSATTVLTFLPPPGCTPLPAWLWGTLLLRDGVLGAGWLVIWWRHRAVSVEHRWHGRLATLLLFTCVVLAFAGAPAAVLAFGSAVVVALTLPGTVDYLREGWRQLRRAPPR